MQGFVLAFYIKMQKKAAALCEFQKAAAPVHDRFVSRLEPSVVRREWGVWLILILVVSLYLRLKAPI